MRQTISIVLLLLNSNSSKAINIFFWGVGAGLSPSADGAV